MVKKRDVLKRREKHYDDDDDDSSVDSKGNIRDLIDYDYDEEDDLDEDYSTDSTRNTIVKRRPTQRKSVIKAMRRIRRQIELSDSESESNKKKIKHIKKNEVKGNKKKISKKEMKRNNNVIESSEDEIETKPNTVSKGNKKYRSKKDDGESSLEDVKPLKNLRKISTLKTTKPAADDDDDENSDDDEEDEEDEDEEESYSDDDEDTEDEKINNAQRIGLMISGFGAPADPNQPKKYKMKEQPPIVKKFVKLVQKETDAEGETHNIDNDISYFKRLSDSKQNLIIEKMERKFSLDECQVPLKFKILEKQVPQQVEKLALGKYNALMNMDSSSTEYYKGFHWIEGYSNIPLGVYKDLPVKLDDGSEACGNFVSKVRQNMDDAIYGHDEAKLQILQFVSSWIANPKGIGNVLSIYGPMGVGKTTLVKDGVAKALERPFHFVSLGGASDASYLDGHSFTYEGSTWGRIVDILIQSKCMNPIIYFDELDKISETPKGEEIMNLLIHITDSSQNDRFQDKYFAGIDLDLSRCLFIFSHNNHERVNPILRDRMYNIRVSGFNLKEKQVIAEQYLIDQTLKEIGLYEKLSISKDVIQYIIEDFTGDEKGVRELKRCIHTVMSKLNLLRFYNDPKKVPFAIPDFTLPFILKKEHIGLLLKKKEEEDTSWKTLYS